MNTIELNQEGEEELNEPESQSQFVDLEPVPFGGDNLGEEVEEYSQTSNNDGDLDVRDVIDDDDAMDEPGPSQGRADPPDPPDHSVDHSTENEPPPNHSENDADHPEDGEVIAMDEPGPSQGRADPPDPPPDHSVDHSTENEPPPDHSEDEVNEVEKNVTSVGMETPK